MAPTPISEFNEVYFQFLKFIKSNMEDPNFKSFYRKNKFMRETNPKFFIRTWYNRIGSNYHAQVMMRDISFFLNKNYEDDVSDSGESNMLLKYINKFKESYDTLNNEIKENFLNYIIVLTDKSFVYYK
jgi:hypothetical protein